MRACTVQDCERKHKAKGLCTYHYNSELMKVTRVTPEYRTWHIWYVMGWRCAKTSGYYYKYYGSRGIKVCKRWFDYKNFLADMGLVPDKYSLERIDNDKGYSPDNCRWATMKEQSMNRRTSHFVVIDGEKKTIAEWVDTATAKNPKLSKHSLRGIFYNKGEQTFIQTIKSV